jgi:hypothetical protein
VSSCLEANAGAWHYSAELSAIANLRRFFARLLLETHGPLGTLITGLGLGAFFLALTWVNLLLGHMLTPLFIIPITWLMDAISARRRRST